MLESQQGYAGSAPGPCDAGIESPERRTRPWQVAGSAYGATWPTTRHLMVVSPDSSLHHQRHLGDLFRRWGNQMGVSTTLTGWSQRLRPPPGNDLAEQLHADDATVGHPIPTTALSIDLPHTVTNEDALAAVDLILAGASAWVVTRRAVVGNGALPRKPYLERFALSRRAAGSKEEYRRRYLIGHVPLVLENNPLFDGYVVNLVDAPNNDWDGLTQQRFSSPQRWIDHDRQLFEAKPAVAADLRTLVKTVVQFAATDRIHILGQ
jgi:hypothetical protein